MLQKSRVTAFTVFGLLRENQQGGLKINPSPYLDWSEALTPQNGQTHSNNSSAPICVSVFDHLVSS